MGMNSQRDVRRLDHQGWRWYRKTALQRMRPYVPGEDLAGISVADSETPVEGGMIAGDAAGALWYITPEFMAANYEKA